MADPRPLHVGMEWPDDRPGGLNRYLAGLHGALSTDGGAAPRAVVLGPANERPRGVRAAGSPSLPVPLRLWAIARAVRTELDVGFEVLAGHFPLYTAAALMAGREVRARPLVAHFHGPWADEWRAVGRRGPIGSLVRSGVERHVLRRAQAVVCVSPAFRQLAIERYRLDPWRVRSIPPGVDQSLFAPGDRDTARGRLGIRSDAFVTVCVRRLVPRCGVAELVGEWALDPPGLLVVVGDGPERPALETMAARSEGSVRVLGWVDDDGLVDVYRAADASVVPSIALEGFGLVSLEAMACGTPVVVADVGGAADPVRALDPTAVVPPGEPSELVDRIRRHLHGEQPLRPRDEVEAHARAWSWAAVAAVHRELYAEVVERADGDRRRRRGRRVVVVAHTAALGGAEIMLDRLAASWASSDAGLDVHVVVGEHGPLVDRLRAHGVSVEVLAMPDATREIGRDSVGGVRGAGPTLAGIVYATRLGLRLARLRPDAVVAWTTKAAMLAAPGALVRRLPLVWALHENLDAFPGASGRLVRGVLTRRLTGVMANSQGAARSLRGRATCVEVVTPPGLVRAVPSTAGRAPRPSLRVVVLGRLAPLKGQHEAIRAFARAFPHGSAQLRLVGAPLFGEERYADEARRLAARLGIADRVHLVGAVDDPTDELISADVVVHASVGHEAWGMAVLEAMQCGVAVVATDSGGPGEQIVDGVTGLLVPPGDVEAMADAMRRLGDDPALRRRLGAAASAATSTRTPAAVASEWAARLCSILDGAGSRSECGSGHE